MTFNALPAVVVVIVVAVVVIVVVAVVVLAAPSCDALLSRIQTQDNPANRCYRSLAIFFSLKLLIHELLLLRHIFIQILRLGHFFSRSLGIEPKTNKIDSKNFSVQPKTVCFQLKKVRLTFEETLSGHRFTLDCRYSACVTGSIKRLSLSLSLSLLFTHLQALLA